MYDTCTGFLKHFLNSFTVVGDINNNEALLVSHWKHYLYDTESIPAMSTKATVLLFMLHS